MSAALMLSAALMANPGDRQYRVTNTLDIDGEVVRVSDTGMFVEIKTLSGPSMEVPVKSLMLWDSGNDDILNLEPGRRVTTRMNPGVLSFGPMDGNQLWIMMDGNKYARIDRNNLSDGLFDDDNLIVRLDDGREMKTSFEDLAKAQIPSE